MFEELIFVSNSINKLLHITFEENNYGTHNFLQCYVAEQIEEEATAKTILDKVNLIFDEKGGFYLIDREIQLIAVAASDRFKII